MIVTLIDCDNSEAEMITNSLKKRTGIFVHASAVSSESVGEIAFIALNGEASKQKAVSLRKTSPATDIILMSQKASDVQFAFDLPANQFILKKCMEEDILKAFDWVVLDRINCRMKWHVKNKTGSYLLMANDIFYIETKEKGLAIHTVKGMIACKGSIRETARYFAGYGFYCAHIGYLVNAKYVKAVYQSTVAMENGAVLPISKSHKQDFLNGLQEYQEQKRNYKV